MKKLMRLAAVAALSLMAMHGLATAQKAPAAKQDAEVIKVYDADTLKPADIRACLRQDQRLGDLEQRMADYQTSMANHRERISALEKELDRRRKQIDGTDPEAVKVYNARVERHRTMIDTYNDEMLPTLERRRDQLNQLVKDYNAACADKSYFEEDWQAALADLGIKDPRPSRSGGK